MPHWGWVVLGASLVAGLFFALFMLGDHIEPERRDIDNDEWLEKGRDGD